MFFIMFDSISIGKVEELNEVAGIGEVTNDSQKWYPPLLCSP